MAALHQLTSEMKELEALAQDDPEMELAVADTLEAIQGTFEEKANALAIVANTLDGTDAQIKAEIDRLVVRQKRIKNRKADLVEYLRTNMEATGVKKISCPLFTITLAKGREVVVVDDADEIPDEYMDLPPVVAKANKSRIMEALKAGDEVPGVHKERNKASIRIK